MNTSITSVRKHIYLCFLVLFFLPFYSLANDPDTSSGDIREMISKIVQLSEQKKTAKGLALQQLQKEINQLRQKAFQFSSEANGSMMMPPATCPEMQVQELFGVAGFSETNELVVCGDADTLALLVFIEEPGTVSGTQMTVTLDPGMQYAGFELTHYGNPTTISNVDPNPTKPKFLLEGITEAVFVAYIGVEATCEVDLNSDYTIDVEFNFIYEDTLGNVISCRQKQFPDRVYNTTLKTPVLNFRSVPITTISSLGTEYCQTIEISQDGINAYLNDMDFAICGLDLSNELILTNTYVNNIPITPTYTASDSTLSLHIDNTYFLANSLPDPTDLRFNEDERIQFTFCYQVDACPTINTQDIIYKASFGCNDEVCSEIVRASEIRIRPTSQPEPFATVTKLSNPGVCGEPGVLDITMYAVESGTTTAVQDSAIGLFTDLTLGFETCDVSSLDITKVTLGNTEIASSNFSWIDGDLIVDFTAMTSDPDGPGGLLDADGDGFFDDLPGGETLNLQVELSFICELPDDPTSLACNSIDCSFSQFFISAKRDCGQIFTFYPDIEDFNILNGATYVELKDQEQINTSTIGYDFGIVGRTNACEARPVSVQTVQFCYIYERENVTPCPATNTTNELQVVFSGSPMAVYDVEFVPGSGTVSVNGATTVSGANGTFTDIAPDTRMLSLPIGDLAIGDEVCYTYQLEADTAKCAPAQWMTGTHQVIETCTTPDCVCKIVKACDAALFRIDPTDCNCVCDLSSGSSFKRISLGYTDATMTTKVKEEDVPIEDLNRYLPCDTMLFEGWLVPNTNEALNDPYWWYGRSFISGNNSWTGGDDTELMYDVAGSHFLGFEVGNGDGTRTFVDISSLPSCLDNGTGTSNLIIYSNTSVYDNAPHQHSTFCNTGNDNVDGAYIGWSMYNFDNLEDCRATEVDTWEEGNCLQEFLDAYGIGVGDTIFWSVNVPLTKNPMANANKEADPSFNFLPPNVVSLATGHYLDEFDSDCLIPLANCRETIPFMTFCPQEITASTNMQIDDCGGTVEHTFDVVETTPVNWYTKEYKPYFNFQDIVVPVYTPTMYCGNAKLVTKSGEEYPLTPTAYGNQACAVVGTQEYCSISSGTQGTVTFNVAANGYPGIGVGLGGFLDGFTIEYDLCKVCPAELADVSDYEISYNYSVCEPLDPSCFRCNQTTINTSNELPKVCHALVARGDSYYTHFNMDKYFLFTETSGDLTLTDVSNGFPPLSQTQDRNILSSGSPGVSVEENTVTICANGADPSLEIHKSVTGAITVSNSVSLVGICEVNGTPIDFSFVSSNTTGATYSFPLEDLAPGDCAEVKIKTSLLFCPEEPEVAEVCLTVTSGCLDRNILAAVAGNASGCNTSTSCYRYVTEEAGLQADFLPVNSPFALCGEIPIAVLVKNVREAVLTDLVLDIGLPITGATIVPGSFMASYPNDGDLSLPFYSIVDPTINGNQLIYTEDNDFSNYIHANGFPGINSTQDSNFIVVKFLLETTCDEFVSGSQATFEATANNPCSPEILTSGEVSSDRIIITNANPEDFAQILVTARPSEVYCEQDSPTFTVTGLNISEQPSGDSVQMCITLPADLTYQAGSMRYAIPAGQSVGTELVTMVGNQTQICFAGYNNMPLGGQFTLNFEADFDIDTPCGDYKVGVDIKELIEDESCVLGGTCDVFVQSSINPDFTVTLLGPMETVDLELFSSCQGGDDPVTICYEAKIRNPGADYLGDIQVNLHEDVLANNVFDYYDPVMDSVTHSSTAVLAGDTILLTGCFEIPAGKACPVILNIIYETECECDNNATPYNSISPEFIVDLPQNIFLCPDQELALDTCSNFIVQFDPTNNVTTRTTNDSLYISLVDPSITTEMTIDGVIGKCDVHEPFVIEGIKEFDFVLAESETCQGQPLTLELPVPPAYQDVISVTWTPSTYLDNPTILDPIFTSSVIGDHDYHIEIIFEGSGCVFEGDVTVTVLPIEDLSISGDVEVCEGYLPGTLTTTGGYDYYEWYLLNGGFEILSGYTTTNTWNGPTLAGDYIVKGYSSTQDCPAVSGTHTVRYKECLDLELEKNVVNIPNPFIIGSQVTYELVVCNINDPSLGMVFDAPNVQIADQLPGDVTYVSHTQTSGNYSPTQNEWDISLIENGTCDTLWIDVTVDSYECIINDAQISESDKEDIDSTPNNEDGDQSEDDEDKAKVTVDTFDLALTKKLSPMQTVPVTIGSTVTYDIEVCNQGTVDAYNIEVVDYVPAGMMVTDANWTIGSVANEYFRTISGPITAGNCTTIQLVSTVTSIPPSGSYINHAEISDAEDANGDTPPDIDSDPDNDPGNDGPVTDDVNDNSNGDEDDHDPAQVPVIMLECEIANNSIVCPETPLVLEEIGMNNVSWNWSGPNGFTSTTKTISLNPPVAGTYSVTVTDNNGLTSTCSVEAGIHPEMQLSANLTNLTCKDAEDGSIDLTVVGGTAPFTYDWSNDGADSPDDDAADLMGLAAGTYTVTITDANGCTKDTMFTLTEPTTVSCSLSGTDLACNGDASGSITISGTGGTAPYEYSLNGGAYQSGTTFTGLIAGPHTITIRDANGCTSTCSIALTEPAALSCNASAINDSSCTTDNGSIEIITAGGTTPIEYSIDGVNFQTVGLFSNLSAGIYTVTVKDANGCISTCFATLTAPTLPSCAITASTNISCNGAMDGSLLADGMDGSGTYEFSIDGTTWQNSGSFNSLTVGTYTVTIRNSDTPTCTSTCSVTLTEPTTLSCSLGGTNISCNGDADGSISINPTGGLGNYEYSIDGSITWQTNTTFSGLSAGTYTVQLRDNGDEECITACMITLTEPTALSCTANPTPVLCNGDATGGIQVNAGGGITPLEYSLNGGVWQPGNVFTNLVAGSYSITIRDVNGCTSTCTATITEPLALQCASTKTDITDCGIDDGTITITGTGGTTIYEYSIDGTNYQASNSFTNLMAGTYVLYIKDDNDCISTCEATLTAPDAPVCMVDNVVQVACNGDNTGSLTVSGSTGNPPYEYSIDNTTWQATGTFNNLTAGTYMVFIRNVNNTSCTSVCVVEITEPTALTCSSLTTDVTCKNGNDGTATVLPTGGTTGYMYLWNDPSAQTTSTATGLSVGMYVVTITDANNCTTICSVNVNEPTQLACTLSATELDCNGDTDAIITVTATGGILPYEYSLDGGPYQPGNMFANLGAGTYTLTTKDKNDCTTTCTITIGEPTALTCFTSKTDITDCAISDGTITVTPQGGTTPYTYSLNGGLPQTTTTFTGIGAGTHTIQVTDNQGCTTTCMATITAPTTPSCTIVFSNNISCQNGNDGAVTVEGSGGSGNYAYSLNGGPFQGTNVFTGLIAGNYTITIRNVGNPMCTSTCHVTLTEPEQLTCTTTGFDVSCLGGNDGQASVIAQGGTAGYTYLWSSGATTSTASSLTAGTYQVTVTDAKNCQQVCDIMIAEPTALSFSTAIRNLACNGDASGEVLVTPTGATAPYEYSFDGAAWQPGNLFTGLAAGNHTVSVRDAQGCQLSAILTITEPTPLTCATITTDASNCSVNDGTITITGNGGTPTYEYSIDGTNYQASNTFSGLMAGSYIVSIKDANGCISNCSASINTPDAPMCQISDVDHVACFGDATGSVTVIGTLGNPPYEFSIDNSNWQSSGIFSNLPAGLHTIYIRNSTSTTCVSMCAVEIEQPTEVSCLLTPNDPLCNGGTDGNITTLATGGSPNYEYSLNGSPWQPNHVFNGLSAGDYEVTIRDANGCTKTCSVTLGEPPVLSCSTTTIDLLCNGDASGSITITGTGGTGAYDYNLNNGSWQAGNTFTGLSGGSYLVSIRDEHDCISTCNAILNEPLALACNLVELVPESCAFNDGSIEVLATGGTGTATYSIDGGTTTQATGLFTGLTLGTYTITIEDENACIETCEFEILPDCFDLALVKKLVTAGPYTYGQKVIFDIEVINQGNIDATNVEVTDHIPCGFSYDPALLTNLANNWTSLVSTVPMTVISSLPAQTSTTVQIELTIEMCTTVGGYINEAEISEAYDGDGNLGDDEDSTPDYDPDNDAGGDPDGPSDNQEDGDGMDDEDDHDPALVPVYDLALIKQLVTPPPYAYGDVLEFAVEVCNQAANPVQNITISDYVPVGYSYDAALNPGWVGTSPTPTVLTYIYTTPLLYGADCVSIPLFLTLEMAGGTDDWKNVSEISAFEDEDGDPQDDVDSTPDDDPDNDGDMEDDDTDNTNGDEDDSDFAGPDVVDVALVKTTMDTGPFTYGDTVTFDIEVFNQGNVDLYNTVVNDFVPCGYRYLGINAANWTYNSGTGIATTTIAGPITAGNSTIVSLQVEIQACSSNPANGWTNVSEVASFEDEEGDDRTDDDIDSDADDDPTNDPTDDNTNDNSNGDEDDNDPETIGVFDLAQIKQLITPSPYQYGDLLEYKITVINQGNIAANNITITDHLPIGLSFDAASNPNWDAVNAPDYTYTITTLLEPGDTFCIPYFATLAMTTGGNDDYTNISEITGSEDGDGNDNSGDDADSTPDNDDGNDAGGEPDGPTDNLTDGDGTNDEDDHDPAIVKVFDLALKKTTSATGPFRYGDTITFDFTVYNQGNIPSTNIEITEQTPCGYAFVPTLNPDWIAGSGNTATTIITDTLQGRDSAIVSVTFLIEPCYEAVDNAWKNTGEISGSEDDMGNDTTDDDIDSDADDDPENDGEMKDDETDGEEGDEDDSDFEVIEIFDLALLKTIVGSVSMDGKVTFNITVINQGNVNAFNIGVIDYPITGVNYFSGTSGTITTASGNSTTITDHGDGSFQISELMAEDTVVLEYIVQINTLFTQNTIRNWAEITEADDDMDPTNTPPTDVDSTPDDDQFNGADETDDLDDDNITDNTNGDEDDHDPAEVKLLELDPIGFIYCNTCEGDGNIITGGTISVEPAEQVIITKDGSDGSYQWFTDGTPGSYTMTYNHPAGYPISFTCLPQAGSFDPTGTDGSAIDVDGTIDRMVALGTQDTLNGRLVNQGCAANPFYLDFDLGIGDPFINNNNIAIACSQISSVVCNGNIATTPPPGMPNVQTYLYTCDDLSTPIGTQITDTTGMYNYEGLPAGCYRIQIIQPDGLEFVANDLFNEFGWSEDITINFGQCEEIETICLTDQVFDLALIKTLAPTQSSTVTPGSVVEYTMTVFNQGNVVAYDIDVQDYIPNGLFFNPSNNTAAATGNARNWAVVNGLPTYTLTALAPGAQQTITLRLTVDPTFTGSQIVNYAEIGHASNTPGGPNTPDIDSEPDSDSSNDPGAGPADDNMINNENGDEDDHDPAILFIQPIEEVEEEEEEDQINSYFEIENECTCNGDGLATEKIVIYADVLDDNWRLTQNDGLLTPTGADANYMGADNGEYRYELIVTYRSGETYNATIQNGSTSISISNSCTCPETVVEEPMEEEIDEGATPAFPIEEEGTGECKQTTFCIHGIAVELMPSLGMIEIWAEDLVVNPELHCDNTNITLWHPTRVGDAPASANSASGLSSSLIFTCDHIGTQVVEVHTIDGEGNWNFCQTYVNVQDNMNACTADIETDIPNGMARIAGQINSWKGEAVEAVEVSLEKEAYQTPVTGFYHFDVPMHEDYTITPTKDANPLNGVSTFDLVLMSKHILGIQPFEQPYQWIAADVNRSNTITTFDIVQLRKLILAIDKEFTHNTSWRFITTDYDMNTINPLASDLKEYYELPTLSEHQLIDFIGIKIGDVNGSATPNSLYQAEVRNSKEVLKIEVADQVLQAGQRYEIPFTTQQLAQIQGFQFTIDFDKVRVDRVSEGILQLPNFGLQGLDKGQITTSWETAVGSTTVGSTEVLFTLELLALEDVLIKEVITIQEQPTAVEAYDKTGDLMEVQLQFNTPLESTFELYQNEPNPYHNSTTIKYFLPANDAATLVLRDEAGRVLQVIQQDGKAGLNEIQLKELTLPSGFIYYQLTTRFGTKSKKMLQLK